MIDCACVIHGNYYDWIYVDRLYNMLRRNLSSDITLHVYTEHDRFVPSPYIKHSLVNWPGIAGPHRSWWYKMQLFNPEHHAGPLLYFDLDCVIVKNIDWITECSTDLFWAIKDFKYLQDPRTYILNSSVMWWDTTQFADVWYKFTNSNIQETIKKFRGDQDYILEAVNHNRRRFFPDKDFSSYRWQVLDGGYDFNRRCQKQPGLGVHVSEDTSVIVFHGEPKPMQVSDPLIQNLWR